MPSRITVENQLIAAFCRKWQVTELALFGAVLRDDFDPTGNVDVLVTFADGSAPGLRLVAMQDELSDILGGRRIDLVTKTVLRQPLQERLMSQAEVLFAS